MIRNNADARKKLSVSVLSMADGGAGTEKEVQIVENEPTPYHISDVTVFKSRHEMYPLVQPYINITRKGNKCKL